MKEYEKCENCFDEENVYYMECINNKIPKYGLAQLMAGYLTMYLLLIYDHLPKNWDLGW